MVIPDDISAIDPPAADLRTVVRTAARLRELAPDAVSVADPLAFSGCGGVRGGDGAQAPARLATTLGGAVDRRRVRAGRSADESRPVHPVTMWRGRLAVALDALETEAPVRRRSPVETTNVQLPTGDRLQIPTAAETLRMKSALVLCRNQRSDYAELVDLVDAMNIDNATLVLAGIDGYYSSGRPERSWIATQLVRRLADPIPTEAPDDGRWTGPEAEAEWDDVRRRCLALAVAILEEAS